MSNNERRDFINYLTGYNLHPNQNLGQNFLYSTDLLEAMVEEMDLSSDTTVWEIGVGTGNMTAVLANKFRLVLGVEVDEHLKKGLTDRFSNYDNVILNFTDALTVKSFNEYEDKIFKPESTAIVGNLPYYISTKLLLHFLLNAPNVKQYSFLLQSEFIQRVLSSSGKSYGPLNILLNLFTEAEEGMILGADNFFPSPKVESQMIHIRPKPDFTTSVAVRSDFYNFLQLAFAQRRKTMRNNFPGLQGKYSGLAKLTADEWLGKLDLSEKLRPEAIKVKQWAELYEIAAGNCLN